LQANGGGVLASQGRGDLAKHGRISGTASSEAGRIRGVLEALLLSGAGPIWRKLLFRMPVAIAAMVPLLSGRTPPPHLSSSAQAANKREEFGWVVGLGKERRALKCIGEFFDCISRKDQERDAARLQRLRYRTSVFCAEIRIKDGGITAFFFDEL
jgi:hypothetical protein